MTVIKWITKSIKKQRSERLPTTEQDAAKSVHNTPPGQWPSEGPQPSKAAVVLFYISIIFTVIGTIFTIRTLFFVDFEVHCTMLMPNIIMNICFQDADQARLFFIGCGMVGTGLLLIVITNCINNREHNKIMAYLNGKVEELQMDENSRARRNLRYSAHLNQQQQENLA